MPNPPTPSNSDAIKPTRPVKKKPPKTYIGKNQLKELLDKGSPGSSTKRLTMEDIAQKLGTNMETLRLYIKRYKL